MRQFGDVVIGPDGLPQPVPPGHVCTDRWPLARETVWNGMHRAMRLSVRLASLPREVQALLEANGCGPWLADPDLWVSMGDAVCVQQLPYERYGLRDRFIKIEELARMVKALPLPTRGQAGGPAAPPSDS
jgi:hypothetical protein